MKDLFNKKTTTIYLTIFVFILPILLLISKTVYLDNDIWYLLAEGRYIVNNGVYNIDPLSIHENFSVVVQNWIGASTFYLTYKYLGFFGIFSLILICNFIICFLLYKISMLISDKRKILSLIVTLFTDLFLINTYIVSRPQIFSFIFILSLIYFLEKYIKTNKTKYLISIPILLLIQINVHASLWLMMLAFIFCYIIDSLNIKFLHTQNYKTKPLIIFTIIGILTSLINPYGIKAITFIINSYGDLTALDYVSELSSFSMEFGVCKEVFAIILIVGSLYTFFRKGNVRIRYICMFCGTLLIGFNTVKGFNLFLLVSTFHLAYFFKDILPKEFKICNKLIVPISIISLILASLSLITSIVLFINADFSLLGYNDAKECLDQIENIENKDNIKFYSTYNDGGYVEFRGYKSYLDPRGEVFLKSTNKTADIIVEAIELGSHKIDVNDFLEKYKFDYLLLDASDYIYAYLMYKESNYTLIYKDEKTLYEIYERNDTLTEEQIEYYKNLYASEVKYEEE